MIKPRKKTILSLLLASSAAFYIAANSVQALAFPPAAVLSSTTASRDMVIHVASEEIGKGAQSFINGMAQRAVDFLSNKNMPMEQKANEFRKLLQDSFDMETIGRFALGRYWNVATPDQRKEYMRLFRNMVVKVYSERFKEYQGQKVETRGFRIDGGNDTIVNSFIIPTDGNPEVEVDWRVRHHNGHYQIVDVIVEGVSMSVTQRSDFSSVIQRGGGSVDVLLAHLRK